MVWPTPVANFTSNSPQIYCHNITFTDTTTGGTPSYTWYWDFDDGNSSTEQNPSYHYSAPGTYNVTLNVTDENECTNSTTKQVEVTLVPNISVNKTASPTAGAPSTNVTFTINVTNTGDCTLDPVKVVDTLPSGMSYVATGTSPTPDNAVENADGTWTITWNNVGPLAKQGETGNSTTITLIAHIDGDVLGTLRDSVTATGTPPHGDDVEYRYRRCDRVQRWYRGGKDGRPDFWRSLH